MFYKYKHEQSQRRKLTFELKKRRKKLDIVLLSHLRQKGFFKGWPHNNRITNQSSFWLVVRASLTSQSGGLAFGEKSKQQPRAAKVSLPLTKLFLCSRRKSQQEGIFWSVILCSLKKSRVTEETGLPRRCLSRVPPRSTLPSTIPFPSGLALMFAQYRNVAPLSEPRKRRVK